METKVELDLKPTANVVIKHEKYEVKEEFNIEVNDYSEIHETAGIDFKRFINIKQEDNDPDYILWDQRDAIAKEKSVITNKNNGRIYICDDCHQIFSYRDGIVRHTRRVHGHIKCVFCPRKFGCLETQRKHINNTHMERKFECDLCHVKCSSQKNLNRHNVSVHESKKLQILSKTSENVTVYKCETCKKKFYNLESFNIHKQLDRHPKTVYQCDECEENFTDVRCFIPHKRLHIDDKPMYRCDICNRTFTTKVSLKHHIESHNDLRMYRCEKCSRSFNNRRGLTRHMPSHYPNKLKRQVSLKPVMNSVGKYECEICNTMLSSPSILRRHLLIHKEKSNECKFCGKKFTRKTDLTVHIRTHTKEKPYLCSKCNLRFGVRSNMRKHEKSAH